MRIGYVRLDRGDWANNNYNSQEIGLAKAFEELGHQTYIFYWLKPDDKRCFTEIKLSDNIHKVYFPYRFRIFHHAIVDLNLLKKYNLDILQLQADNLLYLPNAVDYCLKNKISHYCYVGTIKSSNPNFLIRKFLDIITIRNINAFKKTLVFCKTPSMVNTLIAKGVKNARFAPVGLDISIIPPKEMSKADLKKELNIPLDKKIIVFISSLRFHKRPFDIFKLAEILDDSYNILFMGTDGPLKEKFLYTLNSKKEYSKILYLGQKTNREIHKYYQVADYMVNFNPNEIFGMAILEAMYQDCTVIAIDAPGPRCIIENNKSGFIVQTIEEMADVIKNGKKSVNAHDRVIKNFTWRKTAETFLSYFN